MSSSAKIGYARVSSDDQNLARQLEVLKTHNLDKVFTDKVSGKNVERPGFRQMMEYARDGDIIYVVSMDRFARNLKDLLTVTKELQERGIAIHFLKENIYLSPEGETSSMSKLILSIMGAVAEFERSLIHERQKEGIRLAVKRGAYKGRAPIDIKIIDDAKQLIEQGVSKTNVCRQLNISRTTLYKYMSSKDRNGLLNDTKSQKVI